VGTFTRGWFWFENLLWLDDGDLDGGIDGGTDGEIDGLGASAVDGASVSLFISERDRFIDGPTIFADAKAEQARRREKGSRGRRALRSVLWEGTGHGNFLRMSEKRREVIDTVLAG
jgi:hypothetical protein